MKKKSFLNIVIFLLILPIINAQILTILDNTDEVTTSQHLNLTFDFGSNLLHTDYSLTETKNYAIGNANIMGIGITDNFNAEKYLFSIGLDSEVATGSDRILYCDSPCGLSENNCDDPTDFTDLCGGGCAEVDGANITIELNDSVGEVFQNGVSRGNIAICNDTTAGYNKLQTYLLAGTQYVVRSRLVNATLSENVTCPYPSILCEQFIYDNSFFNHGWEIFQTGVGLNTTAIPIDNEMFFQDTIFPEIEIPAKSNCYAQSETISICETRDYPLITIFFDLGIVKQNPANREAFFRVYDDVGVKGLEIVFNDSSIQYQTNQFTNERATLCTNCLDNDTHIYTINIFFKNNASPYFTSVFGNQSSFNLFQDSTQYALELPITNNNFRNVRRVTWANDVDQNFTLDNIYVVAGTDKVTDTTNNFIIPNYVQVNQTELTQTNATIQTDMISRLQNFFNNFGFFSTASKIFISLIVMISVGIAMTLAGVTAPLVLISEIGLLSFFTFIGFIPAWIVLIIVLIGIGLVITIYKNSIGGGD